jgi:cytoskeletal protein CcmA (bactofilin family)
MIEKNSNVAGSSSSTSNVKQTLVEEGTQFKGSLSSNCPIVVKGKIDGDVAAPSLNVSSTGSVHGTVKVTDLRSAGELSGDFESDTVQLSGVVKDNTRIRAKSLEVRLSAPQGKMQVVFGECNLDVGDPLSKEDAIRSATQVAAPPAARPEASGSTQAGNASSPLTSALAQAAEGESAKDAKDTAAAGNEGKGKGSKEGKEAKADADTMAKRSDAPPSKGASVRPKDAKEEDANGALASADK